MSFEKARSADGQERERVLLLLRQYGWNATSFQVLEEGFRYWLAGEDACVAYVDTGSAWVAAGAPITSAERLGEVAQAFVAAAAHAGRRASFFAVERRFIALPPLQVALIGEQPVWNPVAWSAMMDNHRSLREQLRRAWAKGVVIRAVVSAELLRPEAPLAGHRRGHRRGPRRRRHFPPGYPLQP